MADPTTGERFARCLDHVLEQEGGYVDHPNDPGGATKFAVRSACNQGTSPSSWSPASIT